MFFDDFFLFLQDKKSARILYIEESVDYMLHVNREVFLEPKSMTKLELD